MAGRHGEDWPRIGVVQRLVCSASVQPLLCADLSPSVSGSRWFGAALDHMKASRDSDVDEALERYQRGLRERASRSIKQLKSTLKGPYHQESSELAGDLLSAVEELEDSQTNTLSFPGKGRSHSEMAWQELQHSHAVNQLRALLRQQEMEEMESSPHKRRISPTRCPRDTDGSLVVEDLVPILHDQSEYIQHLEAEVKLFKEDFTSIKQRVQVVVVENEKLREELKSRTVRHTLKNLSSASADSPVPCLEVQQSLNTMAVCQSTSPTKSQNQAISPLCPEKEITADETKKWAMELENLRKLHQASAETVEAQLSSSRKDLSEAQKECEDLKGRLRHQEFLLAMPSSVRVGGLCLKCAQLEAVLAQTHTDVHMKTVERLTKERDELMDMLTSLRSNLSDMQERETIVCHQIKRAVETAEEANLEKAQALVQCEHLKNEMSRQKERLEQELTFQQEKIANAKKTVQEEMGKEKEYLAARVTCLSERVACLEDQVQRLMKEKNSIANQLEEAQKQLTFNDLNINKECGELRYQLNQVKMKKDETEKEFREYRSKTLREIELQEQETQKLGLELSETKRRLEHAQQNTAQAKSECLKMTELLSKSEHQLHLTRLEKDSFFRSHSDDIKALAFQAQHRERELTEKMQQMEAQHDKTVTDLDTLLSSQNTLINKLKAECRTLNWKLEQVAGKNRSDVGHLFQEKEYQQERLEKLQKRNDEMEEQCIQHGEMHEKMKQRLRQLDQHCQASAQQVVELLHKQNELLRERQALTEKVQVVKLSESTEAKIYFSTCRKGREEQRHVGWCI
uniref:Serologically defined colon cancer antigen 8 n=1 Tax=Callorhinchus milii TaxID=7868 RepID=A0A4W3K6Y7_CALMI